jgi:hypothetical protein
MRLRIVTQISGRVMDLYSQALALIKALVCKLVNNLRVRYIQVSQSVECFYSQLVLTLLNIKAQLVLNLTLVELSIQAGLITVLHKVGQLGQLLVITVRKIRRLVIQAFRQGV